MISLRGRIVPVYDLATHLNLVAENRDESNIAIVETGTELIDSIAKIDDRLVVLINPSTIVAETF